MTRYSIRSDAAPWENTTVSGTFAQARDRASLIAEVHGGQVDVIDHDTWRILTTVQA